MPRLRSRHYGGSLLIGAPTSGAKAISASSATLSPGNGSFTFAWWGRHFASTAAGTKSIVQYDTSDYASGWLVNFDAPYKLSIYVHSGGALLQAAGVVRDQRWHRYVVVANATAHTVSLYVDGILSGGPVSNTWAAMTASAAIALGAGQFTSGGGAMADAVYDVGHAWTLAQVQADYYHGKTPGTETHRWPLDDGAGISARATIGGLALTLSGGAAFSADSPMKARVASGTRTLSAARVLSTARALVT